MPHSTDNGKDGKFKARKNIVLCFDGTGNTFRGTDGDTNVAKLLSMLDRNHPDQFHYYQPGIGTYEVGETSVNKAFLGGIRSKVMKGIDQGWGTTFDAHVIAGYRFLMQYYKSGAKIYIFGFSRGAYTARFLSAMIYKVGLLCKGNEEMVPFAYKLYQNYLKEKGKAELQKFHPHPVLQQTDADKQTDADRQPSCSNQTNGTKQAVDDKLKRHDSERWQTTAESERTHLLSAHEPEHMCENVIDAVTAFRRTFCRMDKGLSEDKPETYIQVHFLGLWDCVGSVAVLEQSAPVEIPVHGTATYIRHAVAVDERRVKFKPALFLPHCNEEKENVKETNIVAVKEVWFPGNHGDVGGGWSSAPLPADPPNTAWGKVKGFFKGFGRLDEPIEPEQKEPIQMSDIPLDWMVHELDAIAKAEKPNGTAKPGLKWRNDTRKIFEDHIQYKNNDSFLTKSFLHDTLKFGFGSSFFEVVLWNFLEWLPMVIMRLELNDKEWVPTRFPPNRGDTRDIPAEATFHRSLVNRLKKSKEYNYHPMNNHGGTSNTPCLTKSTVFAEHRKSTEPQQGHRHQLYSIGESGGR